jgi:hypothetical protein
MFLINEEPYVWFIISFLNKIVHLLKKFQIFTLNKDLKQDTSKNCGPMIDSSFILSPKGRTLFLQL